LREATEALAELVAVTDTAAEASRLGFRFPGGEPPHLGSIEYALERLDAD